MDTDAKPGRRRGDDTRAALIEAAENLMLEEGYAAVTARKLMARAGLKSQLLHYYFSSVDELFVAVIRRRFDMNRDRMAAVLSSEDPLIAAWDYAEDQRNARLSMEFVALAMHRAAVSEEVRRFAEQSRRAQVDAAHRYFSARGIAPDVPPVVSVMIISSLWQTLHNEAAHGIEYGHAELEAFIRSRLAILREMGASVPATMPGDDAGAIAAPAA